MRFVSLWRKVIEAETKKVQEHKATATISWTMNLLKMSQFHLTIASRGMFFFQDNSRYSLWSKVDNIGQHVIMFMDSIIVLKRNPLRFCLRLCWRERMILWEGKDSRFGLFHFPPHRTRMTRPPAEGEEKTLSLDGNVEMFRKRIVDKSCKFKTCLT